MNHRNVSMRIFKSFLLAAAVLLSGAATGAPCESEDFVLRVSGESECLLMRKHGSEAPTTLLVWLHGDVSSGGPATYHFSQAETAASALADQNLLSVALVRPGYGDGSGASSSVSFFHSGRSDHYTKENLTQVATAISRLKLQFKASRVVAVGHSGGAASIAVILGMRPDLIDGAVLVSCPCDLTTWRQGRRPWGRSEDPALWASKVNSLARVIALTGADDDNTYPSLASTYVDGLSARGVKASFRSLPNAGHNNAFRSPEVLSAIKELVEAR